MKIELTFDDDIEIDSNEILGTLKLLGIKGAIEDHDTYLDSWILGLIKGLNKIQLEPSVSIDLIDEPYPLNFKKNDKGLAITYKNQEVLINGTEELKEALLQASKKIISKFNTSELIQNNILSDIAHFAES